QPRSAVEALALRAVHQERQRDAGQEEEDRGRHAADELGINEGAAAAQVATKEGIEDVSLEHDRRGQAAKPVEILQAMSVTAGVHDGEMGNELLTDRTAGDSPG